MLILCLFYTYSILVLCHAFPVARLLPLYFPRDKAEEEAASEVLPEDTGDETGGALTLHRKIRIASAPPHSHGGTLTPRSASR